MARNSSILPVLLCVATLLVYANTFGLGFALDAVALIRRDPRVHAATLQNLGLIFRNDYWWPSSVDTLYRPVTTLSFLFNYAILGNADGPTGYHVLNVLLHAINSMLVFALALRLFRDRTPAFLAACLWMAHPITTEAVANIAGRADLLAALWVLTALDVYKRQAHYGVVVRQENPDRSHARSRASGSVARTIVPRPGADSTAKTPPKWLTRSSMPNNPMPFPRSV